MITILMPMAGEGKRFQDVGYKDLKPMIDVCGKPMVETAIKNLAPNEPYRFVFVVQKSFMKRYGDKFRKMIKDQDVILEVPYLTAGTACSMLVASDYLEGELLVGYCDQLVDIDINDFLKTARKYDVCVMTFKDDDPKWSYIKLNGNKIIEAKEKIVISDQAFVGIYYYKNGLDCKKAIETMIEKDVRYNNEFFLSHSFNEMKDKSFYAYDIPKEMMHGLGTPKDLEKYVSNC
jgi:NDP-sugar pyrophosphorylase family protein